MQRLIPLLTFFIATNSYAYKCESHELTLSIKLEKKAAINELKQKNRESIFQGFLFEITEKKSKQESSKAKLLSHFLMQTEADPDQRAFVELLAYSSEIDSGKIKSLNLREVCELNQKIPAKNPKKQ